MYSPGNYINGALPIKNWGTLLMSSHKQLSEEINESLGTEIDWHQLPKEDLQKFKELLDDGHMMERTAKHYIKIHGSEKFENEIDEWYPGKYALKHLI